MSFIKCICLYICIYVLIKQDAHYKSGRTMPMFCTRIPIQRAYISWLNSRERWKTLLIAAEHISRFYRDFCDRRVDTFSRKCNMHCGGTRALFFYLASHFLPLKLPLIAQGTCRGARSHSFSFTLPCPDYYSCYCY